MVDPTINSTNLWEFNGTSYDDLAAMADITLGSFNGTPGPSVSGGACNISDPTNWGAPEGGSSHPCWDYFPIIHITGNGNMKGGSGQGILLIDGDADWDGGDFTFYGIVMIKGKMGEWDDGPGAYGAVIAHKMDRIRDGSFAHYSSCAVDRMLEGLGLGGGGASLTPLSWSEVLW